MKGVIKKYKIKPEFIINMDETPFYWESLPHKVVTPTLSTKIENGKKDSIISEVL